ncbi:MAG: hypothetical protein EXS08_15545 [Planctomycetes bacterium]|nr:hypothetical protein [Planctomycetota bacterium]
MDSGHGCSGRLERRTVLLDPSERELLPAGLRGRRRRLGLGHEPAHRRSDEPPVLPRRQRPLSAGHHARAGLRRGVRNGSRARALPGCARVGRAHRPVRGARDRRVQPARARLADRLGLASAGAERLLRRRVAHAEPLPLRHPVGRQPARVCADRRRRQPDGHDPARLILAARGLLLDPRTWIADGGLWIEGGSVRGVLRSRAAVRRARRGHAGRVLELGELVLTPGLIDAHAHLELGALLGRLPADAGFSAWIGALVRARQRLACGDFARAVRAGARALLATGTTAVGDIDASGACARLAPELGPRLVVYREILDAWDPARTGAALAGVRTRLRPRARVREGLSPHAPYTSSPALLRQAHALARRRSLALTIHWAETSAERAWLEYGTGPLAALLPSAPRRAGLALLDEAGLLTPRTSLVHGNDARPRELALLAKRGVTLVHCPGTHAYFGRARFPFTACRAAGIPLALGTDSLASNTALDLRREMALLRASHPRLAPEEVFTAATEGGARALSWPELGHLRPGAAADLVAWQLVARSRQAALEELTAGVPAVGRVFVGGRPWT